MIRRTPILEPAVLALMLLGPALSADAQAPASPTTPATPAPAPVAEPVPAPAAPNIKAVVDKEQEEAARQFAASLEPRPNGLTADEVVSMALQNSPQLAKATLEADKAAANRARAKLAFAPRLDVMARYTRLSTITPPILALDVLQPNDDGVFDENDFLRVEQPLIPPIWNQYMVQGSITLPITDWFLTILPTYRGASLLGDVAAQQRKAQELQVSYEARVAFYDYAHALGGETVALASARLLEANVRDLEALVKAGTSTQTELARARAALANAKALAIQMHGLIDLALERLTQIVGKPVDRNRGIGEPLVGLQFGDVPAVEQIRNEAKASRPELIALRTLEKAREHFAQARRGSALPRISASGNVYYANPNQRFFPLRQEFNTTWDVGVTAAWSPNDFAYAYTQAEDAETEVKLVREDLRGFEMQIAIESAAAVTNYQTATSNIAARTEALEAARRYQADQRSLMLAGAATPNDVLLAERDLTAAALGWVDSFIQARVAQAALLKAQGKTGLAYAGPAQSRSTP